MQNEIDPDARRARFVEATRELAATLEPQVFLLWQVETRRFIEGENYVMSPLARAIYGVIWEHVTTGAELNFRPEVAALYHRAPKANTN